MENPELHGKLNNKVPQKSEGDPPPRKPGSKEKGRKRTKTGCLSKYTLNRNQVISNTLADKYDSMP
jgi:hypothetical protein